MSPPSSRTVSRTWAICEPAGVAMSLSRRHVRAGARGAVDEGTGRVHAGGCGVSLWRELHRTLGPGGAASPAVGRCRVHARGRDAGRSGGAGLQSNRQSASGLDPEVPHRHPEPAQALIERVVGTLNRGLASVPRVSRVDEAEIQRRIDSSVDSVGRVTADRRTVVAGATLTTAAVVSQGTLLWVTLDGVAVSIPLAVAVATRRRSSRRSP